MQAQSNFILAGNVNVNDTFNNIDPDKVMQCLTVHLSPYPTESYDLDLDFDGTPDVVMTTGGGGGLGGGSGGCGLAAAGSWASIAYRVDTSTGCCPSTYIANAADTFNAGDTIDDRFSYTDNAIIMAETYGATTGPFIHWWNNIGPKYVGVRLSYSFDTLYCWIKISADQASALSLFTLRIFEFGSNKNTHVGVAEFPELNELTVFPNPASDNLDVRFISNGLQAFQLSLYSSDGRKVRSDIVFPQNGVIESSLRVADLTPGIYHLVCSSGDRWFRNRVVVLQ